MKEELRFKPVLKDGDEVLTSLGVLDEKTAKRLYLAGRITDEWIIEIHEPDQEKTKVTEEKPSVLWSR